ncbi:thiamine pyrophosphate-binding protein [Curvibacter sp. HBC61]|uniref:Thiamine pyrophosphate-binding protein n=1 Tax=Curvibacter cyanobacteriorum TaxID=3026422 RepID=A0ABT5N1H3_9BURK|nr:thiamine pyrophosphate-binding protein [Curvibacter sp. HBC61]MDD0840115.1 thiamine pyrophosphate-binding protein [Curvibacter sp. HBC61]
MNLSERIADWLVQQGITQVFAVTGGGAMYLNQALGAHPGLQCTYLHHEQACAMAAEGYARIAGKPAVVMVTTGPGGINALNGVFGAFTDSIPMLVISGQVKRATCLDYTPVPGLRQLGDQEGPVLQMARPVTKLAEGVGSPEAALTLLPQALVTAVSGRPGPVWLDIPLDVQSAACEPIPAPVFPPALTPATLDADCAHIAERLAQAQRPLILAGTGVRLARAEQDLLAFAEAHGIPVATAWTHDLIASDHPLFAGRPGTIGTRPGNFCLQAADLVIVVGSRLNIRQVSYNWDTFAKHAHVVQVDVDPAELAKPLVQADLKVTADARVFLQALQARCQGGLPSYAPWVQACQAMRERYALKAPPHRGDAIHPYGLVERVCAQLRDDDILVSGNASACILPFQLAPLKPGQRLFSNSGSASMGYDLPAALGAAIAAPERRVVCFAGDGSLQMNLQELQSLKSLGLNVLVVVIDNGGYLSIRLTHDNFFGRIVGATPASGVAFPDFARLATAFGLRAVDVRSTADLPALDAALQQDGPQLLAVTVDPEPGFEPRIKSRALPEGGFATPELDDMFPFLPAEELAAVRAELAAVRQG